MKFSKHLFLVSILIVSLVIICPAQTLVKSFKAGTAYQYEGVMQVKSELFFANSGKGPQPLRSESVVYPARKIGDQEVLPIKQTLNGLTSFQFLAEDKEGIYICAVQGPNDLEPKIMPGKRYSLKYPMEIGTAWDYRNERGEVINSRIAVKETVTVIAGNFECLKIEQAGKRDFQGQIANFKGYEWINLSGLTVKSYAEFQIKDPVFGHQATVQISLQLASIAKQ
jgi:hypothetical protein